MSHNLFAATLVVAIFSASCASRYDRGAIAAREREAFRAPPSSSAEAERFELEPADQLPAEPTLDDYLRIALWRNATVRAAFSRWRAAVEQAPQVGTMPDPRFSFAYFIEPIQTRTGPQNSRIGLAQTLPWPGKLGAREEVATRDAETLWWQVEVERRALTRAVTQAWYDYARLARDVALTADALALLSELEPVVQRRVQGGASQAELLQLQVEIGKVEDQLRGLESYRPALSARLAALLHQSRVESLPWPELSVPDETELPRLRDLRAKLAANPELSKLSQAVAAAMARVDAAEYEGLPDVTVGVDYFDIGPAQSAGVPDSGTDPWSVSVSMNLPLYRSRYSAMVDQAEHGREAARRAFEARADALHADLRMALYRLDEAARQIALYRVELLPRARQALELTRKAYAAGSVGMLDVIAQERELLAFEQVFWRACAEWGKAGADLEALCGGLDSNQEAGS